MRKIFFVLAVLVFSSIPKVSFANNSILLNEIMANPSDNTEWVELYNPTNQAVDLTNWKIKDGNNLSNDDLIITGQLNPLSFITFDHNKGWLNNSGSETVSLMDNNGQVLDSYTYSGTTKGKTYGRRPDGLNWIAGLDSSKGTSNGEQPLPTPTPTPTPIPVPTATPTPQPIVKPSPVPTPTPTPKLAATPNISPTVNPSVVRTEGLSITWARRIASASAYRVASVAGASASASSPPSPAEVEVKDQKKINPFIWIGLVFMFAGAGSVGYIYLKRNGKIHLKL